MAAKTLDEQVEVLRKRLDQQREEIDELKAWRKKASYALAKLQEDFDEAYEEDDEEEEEDEEEEDDLDEELDDEVDEEDDEEDEEPDGNPRED